MHVASRSFLSSRSFRPFLTGAAVGAIAVIGIADESPPLPCTFQPQVKEQAQTPPSAPALPAPKQQGETIPTPAPSVQESGRVTVETRTLAESQTLPPVQAQTPPSAPALPAPERRGEAIPTPAPSVQESGRVTVETPSLAESQTLPRVQAPGPAKVQAKASRKAKASRQAKPRPKVPEPAGYWNSSQFAAGLH